jgi:hypothetical protein
MGSGLAAVPRPGLIPRVRANPEIASRVQARGRLWFARTPPRKATVALANKMARVARALLARRTTYRAPLPLETAQPA